MAIVSLTDAKTHLHITSSANDADVTAKLAAAEAIILDYLKGRSIAGSTGVVKAAILLQLGELYQFRGDDVQAPEQTSGDLSPVVTNLLRRLRDPALA
jgi:hypothetical protein